MSGNPQTKNHQKFMARMLNLNPNNPSDWPMKTIDKLIAIDNERGREAVLKEIHYMYEPPLKSIEERIADLIVEKLVEKGIRYGKY